MPRPALVQIPAAAQLAGQVYALLALGDELQRVPGARAGHVGLGLGEVEAALLHGVGGHVQINRSVLAGAHIAVRFEGGDGDLPGKAQPVATEFEAPRGVIRRSAQRALAAGAAGQPGIEAG